MRNCEKNRDAPVQRENPIAIFFKETGYKLSITSSDDICMSSDPGNSVSGAMRGEADPGEVFARDGYVLMPALHGSSDSTLCRGNRVCGRGGVEGR